MCAVVHKDSHCDLLCKSIPVIVAWHCEIVARYIRQGSNPYCDWY